MVLIIWCESTPKLSAQQTIRLSVGDLTVFVSDKTAQEQTSVQNPRRFKLKNRNTDIEELAGFHVLHGVITAH